MKDPAGAKPVLGIVSAMCTYRHEGNLYIHLSFGRVIDRLASRFEKVYLCVPLVDGPPEPSRDYRLEGAHIEVIPQPAYKTSMGALAYPVGIARAYAQVCRKVGTLFIRGLCPYIGPLYLIAWLRRCRVVHWIVSDPVRLLRTHRRAGRWTDACSLAFAWQDRLWTKLGRRLTKGSFVCNGREVGEVFASNKTVVAVSSTITEGEFHVRSDTCREPAVEILFVGFVRPEKGVEYLIEAVNRLETDRPWRLTLVGPVEGFPAYHQRLEELIVRLGVADRIRWAGYVSYGPEMFRRLREADMLVLPTLSEGTPRVLVEARANSVPIVATNVGGIPTSVTDGVDGLLVPPKNPDALARAIERIIADGELRRALIRNGMQSARRMTVDHFVETVMDTLHPEQVSRKT